jgi:hypothetical protein
MINLSLKSGKFIRRFERHYERGEISKEVFDGFCYTDISITTMNDCHFDRVYDPY